jgi:hypothetical protein
MKNSKNNKGMVHVIAWTKEKGQFYDYVLWSRVDELIDKGYVIALAE